jgi:hypothetical protein
VQLESSPKQRPENAKEIDVSLGYSATMCGERSGIGGVGYVFHVMAADTILYVDAAWRWGIAVVDCC